MDRLLSMEVFVAVVESGSLTAAAELFGISPPMVGKHIRHLEQRLGASLLSRTTRRQNLTEIGRSYYPRCKALLEELRATEAGTQAMQATPRGHLRLSTTVTYGSIQLAPLLTEYLNNYPDISVELTLNDQVVDLIEEGYDAVIRVGELADSNLIARPLQPYHMAVCAAPSYLTKHGTPVTPEQLTNHQCLNFTHSNQRVEWRLQQADGEFSTQSNGRFQSNNGQALRMAALQGFGIIMQPQLLVADDLVQGHLVSILSDYLAPPRPVHLVYLRDRQQVPKLSTFIEFMMQRLGA
ncbi:LysR family transcriptional regulator [Solimicrobium silvestre]|uniref:Transcriptional regulator n=1 Tax=Solimicrobium silvestre TaxID=2099400 RepID=A0A2S9H031_9BURK|nr:LysR family transcriptional regulator [Solimicrobium silvestre]PRC93310.1 Transcriptional regulator [Solimicrobium silvestre]